MRREFSAGGVLVRRLERPLDDRGDPARRAGRPGVWALPKGRIDDGRAGRGDRAARGGRGDRRPRPLAREARRRPLLVQLGGRADLQGRLVLPRPLRGRPARRRARGVPARGRRGALAPARRRAAAPRLRRRAGDGPEGAGAARRGRMIGAPVPVLRAQLLFADRRGAAQVAPQDRDDPARRQVAQVPEGDDRLGARAAPASARASTSSTR